MDNTIPDKEPLALFSEWLEDAKVHEAKYPEACALATASPDGAPHARMVLLRDFGPEGFIFYTNMSSMKGQDLLANPKASLLFHWKSTGRQIRIEGICETVADEVSDRYFAGRPRGSQLASIASDQSSPLSDRSVYENAHKALEEEYADGRPIPRPDHWRGSRLVPQRIEFWEDRPYRMHHRFEFRRDAKQQWQSQLLYP